MDDAKDRKYLRKIMKRSIARNKEDTMFAMGREVAGLWGKREANERFLDGAEVSTYIDDDPFTYVKLQYYDISGRGFAKRNPIDPVRPEIGRNIAFARAFRDLEMELVRKSIEKSTIDWEDYHKLGSEEIFKIAEEN